MSCRIFWRSIFYFLYFLKYSISCNLFRRRRCTHDSSVHVIATNKKKHTAYAASFEHADCDSDSNLSVTKTISRSMFFVRPVYCKGSETKEIETPTEIDQQGKDQHGTSSHCSRRQYRSRSSSSPSSSSCRMTAGSSRFEAFKPSKSTSSSVFSMRSTVL